MESLIDHLCGTNSTSRILENQDGITGVIRKAFNLQKNGFRKLGKEERITEAMRSSRGLRALCVQRTHERVSSLF